MLKVGMGCVSPIFLLHILGQPIRSLGWSPGPISVALVEQAFAWKVAGKIWVCLEACLLLTSLGHPRFFNQLSTGLDIIGLAGEWLTSTANTNM